MIGIGGATKYAIHKASRRTGSRTAKSFSMPCCLPEWQVWVSCWLGFWVLYPICRWLGSDAATHDKMVVYLRTLYCFAPLFLCNQLFAAFVRNDGAPNRVMLGTMLGYTGQHCIGLSVYSSRLGMGMLGQSWSTACAPLHRHYHFRVSISENRPVQIRVRPCRLRWTDVPVRFFLTRRGGVDYRSCLWDCHFLF